VVKAVADRDVGRARKLLREHIMHTRSAILVAVKELRLTDKGTSPVEGSIDR
jgi:DNA-binding GntR family transcriptional regulator